MREILFRAKHEDTGKWIYGDLIHEPFGTCIQYLDNGKRIKSKINENTICQYIGLTDKNGNKIFEKDIVRTMQGACGSVKFGQYREPDTDYGYFIDWDSPYYRSDICFWNNVGIEVIGNVFDNADLLEE